MKIQITKEQDKAINNPFEREIEFKIAINKR